jgi:AcrR family transcriptional regulator
LDPLFGLAEDDPKRRLAQAAVRCLDDVAMTDLGLEAVAREAGLSRATLYRVFPNGRDELLRTALATEVAEFWRNLANAVAEETTLEGRLTRGLIDGVLRTENHALLQRLVHQEAEEFALFLDELEPAVFTLLSAYLADLLDRFSSDLAPGGRPRRGLALPGHLDPELPGQPGIDRFHRRGAGGPPGPHPAARRNPGVGHSAERDAHRHRA